MGEKEPPDPLTCAVDPLRSSTGKADQAAHGKSAHQAAPGHDLRLFYCSRIRQLCHAEGNRREPNGLSAVRTFDKRVAVSPTEQDFDLVVTVRTKTGQSHIAVSGTLRPELILLRLDLCITVRIFDSDIVSWQENHPPPSQNSESSSISTRTRA